jgi:hypothetical protein
MWATIKSWLSLADRKRLGCSRWKDNAMVEPLSAHIMDQLSQVVGLYHRLVLVVAPSGAGKTAALREIAAQTNGHYINVNLELSRRLLDLPQRQWPIQAPRLLEDIVQGDREQVILLDNVELLFDVALQLHPLRCLQTLARQRTIARLGMAR